MRIDAARFKTHEALAAIALVVAIAVLAEEHLSACGEQDMAVIDQLQAHGLLQAIGENVETVGLAIGVRISDHQDTVARMALVVRFLEMRVALDGPDPACRVDIDRHRGDDIRLLAEERQLETFIEDLRLGSMDYPKNCGNNNRGYNCPEAIRSHRNLQLKSPLDGPAMITHPARRESAAAGF